MAFNLLDRKNRDLFLQSIISNENKDRKEKSIKDYDVLNDNMFEYIREYLLSQFSQQTVLETPIVSSINLAKRVATKEASIYKEGPERTFTGLTDDQVNELKEKYEEWKINQKLFKSNVYFKDQNQSTLQVVPKDGKLDVRVLMLHHFDVIPKLNDPEKAESYIISSFDKSNIPIPRDGINEIIGDADDYKSTMDRYITWDAESNFVFNGKGDLVSEVLPNPIGMLPFIDIAYEKDFEFFVRAGSSLTSFAIQYAGAISDLGNIVKMQGYSVAYLIAEKELLPSGLKIGPNYLLRLPLSETGPRPEFGFASPNSDIAGSISYIEMLLSNFLTSRGLDPNIVNGKMQAQKYSSGIDRLLSMIESFSANKQDYDLYKTVEYRLFELIKKWSQVTSGTDQAFLSFAIPDSAEMYCQYKEPEMLETEAEELATIQTKLDLGLMSKEMAVMDLYEVDSEKAKKMLEEIAADNELQLPEPVVVDVTEKKA
jgi:hypothetical protein